MSLCKVCDLPDWEDEGFRVLLDELHLSWVRERKHRKGWEWAKGIQGLERLGALKPHARAIGVGAGHEAPLYYLANRIKEVHATDIYGSGAFVRGEGAGGMLEDPERFAPFYYRKDHLVVRHMDGCNLEYPDESFEIAFSFSSVEHFGGHEAASEAMKEMARVLHPGGVAAITTEVILNGQSHPEFFLPEELYEYLVRPSGMELVEKEIDFTISPSLVENPVDMDALIADGKLEQLWAFGRCDHTSEYLYNLDWSADYGDILPYIVLKSGPVVFTSVIMFLRKPDTPQIGDHGSLETPERARPRHMTEATRPASPPDQHGEAPPKANAKANASLKEKLRVVKRRLEQGPAAAGAPPGPGLVGRLARRLVLRQMRPFVSYQRRLDTAMLDTLQEAARTQEQVTRRLRRLREQLQGQLQGQVGALQEVTRSQEQIQGRLDALDAKLSEVVAGIELGSVPAKETLYLGHPFVYPYGSSIGDLIEHGNEWDPVLRKIVSELLPEEEPMICEVGANLGASLLQMLAAKPHTRAVVFEPSARFRPFLERNLELAGFDRDRVEVFPLLVGRESGSMWLNEFDTTASAVVTHIEGYEHRGKRLTEMTTLDEAFGDRGPVDFIKVDTDGFDFEVLRGAETVLRRDRPVLHFEFAPYCLVERAPSEPVEGLTWLRSVGYRRFLCLNPSGQPVGTTEDPEQATAWADANTYCDVLTCPEGSASEALLESIELG